MIPASLTPEGGKFDIFAVFTKLNLTEHRKILHDDTFFITIFRDPTRVFESLYRSYEMEKSYGMTLEQYLSHPIEVSK